MQMEKKLKKLYNGVLLKEYVEPSELGDKHSQKVLPVKQSKVTKRPKRTKPISHGPPKKRKVCLYKLTITLIIICIILFTLQNTFRVPSLSLTLYDKDVIESTEGLLSDKHMLAANEIFANQFPSLQGLQSTLLCQSDGFVPISIDGGSGYITEGKLPYTSNCCHHLDVVIKTVIIVLFVIALRLSVHTGWQPHILMEKSGSLTAPSMVG